MIVCAEKPEHEISGDCEAPVCALVETEVSKVESDEMELLIDDEHSNVSSSKLESDDCAQELGRTQASTDETGTPPSSKSMCWKVLFLLAVQNCCKNLLMRYTMKDKPQFLLSAAVLSVELLKLILSCSYILLVERKSLWSVLFFLQTDYRNGILLLIPAAAYSLQMTLEYVALANIDAAFFSVLVQTKLMTTALCSAVFLGKRLSKAQIASLTILTVGVMLCNMRNFALKQAEEEEEERMRLDSIKGVAATLGIALSSGFASVYTEKVIKARRDPNSQEQSFSLAYVQVQLALVSLCVMGIFATCKDYGEIKENGLFHNFNGPAALTVVSSALGGLTVAAVLKFADSVLKGYATSVSVVLTGVLSVLLFGTQLDALYFLGIVNVVCAIFLYNGKGLEEHAY